MLLHPIPDKFCNGQELPYSFSRSFTCFEDCLQIAIEGLFSIYLEHCHFSGRG